MRTSFNVVAHRRLEVMTFCSNILAEDSKHGRQIAIKIVDREVSAEALHRLACGTCGDRDKNSSRRENLVRWAVPTRCGLVDAQSSAWRREIRG